ncbi:hypothetical protein PC123_g28929 [Phytophthora cactorum]|nr:hypothetical protein PC123_g28929 [Phytophthora cactorum]
MLLLDDFSGHWVDGVVEYARSLNVLLQKVPAGLTWLSQPADAVWIRPLKHRLRGYWVEFLRDQLRQYTGTNSTDKFTMKAPQRSTIVKWVISAWRELPPTTIAAGFRKCHLTDAGDDPAGYELDEDDEVQASINAVATQLQQLDAFAVVAEDDIVESALV